MGLNEQVHNTEKRRAQSEPKCRECRECHTVKPIDQFATMANGRRRRRICNTCRRKRAKPRKRKEEWDWARAMLKSLKHRLSHAVNNGKYGQYSSALDADVLRSLLEIQKQRCPVTGKTFHVPFTSEIGGVNKGYATWLEKATDEVRARAPALIRINRAGDWAPGNILLVIGPIADCCNAAGDLQMLREALVAQLVNPDVMTTAKNLVRPLVVPMAEVIAEVTARRHKEERGK